MEISEERPEDETGAIFGATVLVASIVQYEIEETATEVQRKRPQKR